MSSPHDALFRCAVPSPAWPDAEVQVWLERVLDAKDLDEVFAARD